MNDIYKKLSRYTIEDRLNKCYTESLKSLKFLGFDFNKKVNNPLYFPWLIDSFISACLIANDSHPMREFKTDRKDYVFTGIMKKFYDAFPPYAKSGDISDILRPIGSQQIEYQSNF